MIRGFLILALCLLFSGTAHACAVLERASPRVGSTVSGVLPAVRLYFSMRVYPKDSTLTVLNEAGEPVNIGKPSGDAKDNTVIAVPVHALPPGRYKVVWNVFAACGSHEPGDFKFTVAPPGTSTETYIYHRGQP